MKPVIVLLGLLTLSGCGGAIEMSQIKGRALLGSGGCGAPPPDGVCPNPVVYGPFSNVFLRVYDEGSETVLATTTADFEGRFSLYLPSGSYRVVAEQLPGLSVPLTAQGRVLSPTLSFYQPPP
jgi:hypothetical protein